MAEIAAYLHNSLTEIAALHSKFMAEIAADLHNSLTEIDTNLKHHMLKMKHFWLNLH